MRLATVYSSGSRAHLERADPSDGGRASCDRLPDLGVSVLAVVVLSSTGDGRAVSTTSRLAP